MSNSQAASANHGEEVEEAEKEEIVALMNRIRDHDANRAFVDWDSLRRVVQAFVINGEELTTLISAPDTHPGLLRIIFSQERVAERDVYFDELYRRLHNFLAILATLTDNARALVNKYQRTDFHLEYKNRVSELAHLPVAVFLKDFRNYLVHSRVPPLSMNVSLQRAESDLQTPSFSITLDAQRLLEWDSWKMDSKSFLRTRKEVVLIDCVTEYTEQITELYNWMLPCYEILHAGQITELHALQDRARKLLGFEDAPATDSHYTAAGRNPDPHQ